MQKHIITLTGSPGSGKSSTAKRVAEVLGYTHISSGGFFREMAKERGLSVEELGELARHDPTIDPGIEARVRALADKEENVVIETRTAPYLIPEAFKVLLKLDQHTAAERIYKHIRQEGREAQTASSVADAYEKVKMRFEAEKERYRTHYNVDYSDESRFDLVIDTALQPLEEVVEKIVITYKEWLAN